MNFMRVFFSSLMLVVAFACSLATASVSVIYKSSDGAEAVSMIKNSGVVEEVVELLNSEFNFANQLTIVFGEEDGPLYDPNINEIHIPYFFITEVEERFLFSGYEETGISIEDATMDALMHTLFHEAAHSFIYMFDLPVIGKEEDAADSLATVLLVEFYEDGAEIAITAADLFQLESEDTEAFSDESFWDEHSLDIQRFYATLCQVYGSNPDEYGYLKESVGFSDERAELCEEEYYNLVRSWMMLLEPYMAE